MNNKLLISLLLSVFLISCSSKKQVVYFNDFNKYTKENSNELFVVNAKKTYSIQAGDILKIDVKTIIPEAAFAYNSLTSVKNLHTKELLILEGYKVDEDMTITYPVLGKISVEDLSIKELEKKMTKRLFEEGHLTNPTVKINRLNFKFTVLGEVMLPGTYSYMEERVNIFQALGYAGDLTIHAKRKDVVLIREEEQGSKVFRINLNQSNILDKPYFYVKNNDVIIVEPNFSKIKSAGFIGSPSSIASISSLLLSITLLIINK